MPDPVVNPFAPVTDKNPVVALPPSPDVPPGVPPTDPTKPKWALTQEQIDFLVATVISFWPAFKTYWPIILTIAAVFGVGGGLTGRWTAPTTPAMEKPEVKPVTVIVNPPVTPVVTPEKPPVDGPVVAPIQTALTKVVLYTTATVDVKAIAADPALLKVAKVTVDPGVYVAYKFGGKNVPAPCAAIFGADGKVVNVVAFTTAADVVAAVQKQQVK